MFVGNNWAGTADVVDARTYRLTARSTFPDKDARIAEIYTNPAKLAFFLAVRQAIGEGHDQLVDDMFIYHEAGAPGRRPSFADPSGSRSRRAGSCGASRSRATAPTTWASRLTASACSYRLDRQQGARARHRQRPEDARVPLRRQPAREQLLGRRLEDLPREHRPGLHPAGRRDAGEPDRRPRQGRASSSRSCDNQELRDPAPLGHRPEARGGQAPGDELRGAADGAGARRAVRLPAGLVLPRRGSSSTPRRADLDGTTTYDGEPTVGAVTPGGRPAEAHDRAARELRPRLGAPRHGHEPRRGRRCAPPGRWTATPRSSTGRPTDYKLVDVGEKPYWSTNGPTATTCWVSVSGERQGRRHRLRHRRSRWPPSRSATTRSACARAWSPPTSSKSWHP